MVLKSPAAELHAARGAAAGPLVGHGRAAVGLAIGDPFALGVLGSPPPVPGEARLQRRRVDDFEARLVSRVQFLLEAGIDLGEAGVDSSAKYLWSTGADWGAFEGIDVAAYQKDLPLPRALSDDVLLAFAMNGRPLAAEHGFPVRLVVPGFFGTNSVKWLTRMTLADRRADSAFVTRWYNDPVRDAAGTPTAATRPVWSLHPEAIIVAPAPDAQLAAGKPATIWGWAWGDGAIAKVEVRTGDGQPWQPAGLAPRRQRAWQRFSIDWTPEKTGPTQIAVRATSVDGETQPEAEWRNCWHRVGTTVI